MKGNDERRKTNGQLTWILPKTSRICCQKTIIGSLLGTKIYTNQNYIYCRRRKTNVIIITNGNVNKCCNYYSYCIIIYYIHKRIERDEEGGTNSSYWHEQRQGINKYVQLAIKAQMIT
jgi:hypothetical protein